MNGRSVYLQHNARPEDAGVYTCLAQNPAGQREVKTVVTVKGKQKEQVIITFKKGRQKVRASVPLSTN